MDEKMLEALKEEESHHFDYFDSNLAYRIGSYISEYALSKDLQICVDIYAFGRTLYHFSSNKCIVDNDNWLRRKRNTVLYFNHSSKFIKYKLKGDSSLLTTKYGLEIKDYAAIEGGFPIYINNCGIVGAICVSGMQDFEDHQMIINGIDSLEK